MQYKFIINNMKKFMQEHIAFSSFMVSALVMITACMIFLFSFKTGVNIGRVVYKVTH